MRSPLLLGGLLLFGACNLPPKDPFVAAEGALRRHDLLRALQAFDAVPVKHERYPEARAAAAGVEQRMRRCHELILEALMLRAEWRDAEALEALHRAFDHWPGQPNLHLWIATTKKRMRLFAASSDDAVTAPEWPAAPLVETAPGSVGPAAAATNLGATPDAAKDDPATTRRDPVEVPSRGPLPMVPMQSSQAADPTAAANAPPTGEVANTAHDVAPALPQNAPPSGIPGSAPQTGEQPVASTANQAPVTAPTTGVAAGHALPSGPVSTSTVGKPVTEAASDPIGKPIHRSEVASAPEQTANNERRVPSAMDPVALGLVAVAKNLGRGERTVAVRDLIELARRFPGDERVNRRLSRLLHQRALMHYGAGAVAAAVADWQRVLLIDPGNETVRRMWKRAVAESPQK